MLNTIGMSESIMKLIEKRNRTDLLVFFGLALLTLVMVVILIWYIKPFLFGASNIPPSAIQMDYQLE
jgi:hypothetical protein